MTNLIPLLAFLLLFAAWAILALEVRREERLRVRQHLLNMSIGLRNASIAMNALLPAMRQATVSMTEFAAAYERTHRR